MSFPQSSTTAPETLAAPGAPSAPVEPIHRRAEEVAGAYRARGAVLLKSLFPAEVVGALAYQISLQVRAAGRQVMRTPSIGNKACYEVSGYRWPFLLTFLWGLTPKMEALTGVRLLPTYCFFRTYQHGDVCRVHADRDACQHSVSLTLAYSDGIEWALDVADEPHDTDRPPTSRGEEDFGGSAHTAFSMAPGDGVLYRGIEFRHGRLLPNPNRWSAHLFMHWVDRDGPYQHAVFDGRDVGGPTDFQFPV